MCRLTCTIHEYEVAYRLSISRLLTKVTLNDLELRNDRRRALSLRHLVLIRFLHGTSSNIMVTKLKSEVVDDGCENVPFAS